MEAKLFACRVHLDAESQMQQESEASPGDICSLVVEHSSLNGSVHNLLCHDVYCDLGSCLQSTLAVFHDPKV